MTDRKLSPVAAFDILHGVPEPFEEAWPNSVGGGDYRWLHLDVGNTSLKDWAHKYLPQIAADAICQSETRPRCERLEDGLILNLRGVNLNPESDPEDMVSLRLWVTKGSVVSARLRRVFAVEALREAALSGRAPATVGQFLADLTHGLTTRIETVSLGLEEQTDMLEDVVSEGASLEPGQLASLRRAVIKMRRFLNPQREAITALSTLEGWVLQPNELAMLRESANRTRRIVEELDATRDRLSALQDHIEASRAHVLSRNSYVLSIVAAIFLPLGFLTGLFGVNLAGMPGADIPSAFWILTGGSALTGIALFLIFKFSKWL